MVKIYFKDRTNQETLALLLSTYMFQFKMIYDKSHLKGGDKVITDTAEEFLSDVKAYYKKDFDKNLLLEALIYQDIEVYHSEKLEEPIKNTAISHIIDIVIPAEDKVEDVDLDEIIREQTKKENQIRLSKLNVSKNVTSALAHFTSNTELNETIEKAKQTIKEKKQADYQEILKKQQEQQSTPIDDSIYDKMFKTTKAPKKTFGRTKSNTRRKQTYQDNVISVYKTSRNLNINTFIFDLAKKLTKDVLILDLSSDAELTMNLSLDENEIIQKRAYQLVKIDKESITQEVVDILTVEVNGIKIIPNFFNTENERLETQTNEMITKVHSVAKFVGELIVYFGMYDPMNNLHSEVLIETPKRLMIFNSKEDNKPLELFEKIKHIQFKPVALNADSGTKYLGKEQSINKTIHAITFEDMGRKYKLIDELEV